MGQLTQFALCVKEITVLHHEAYVSTVKGMQQTKKKKKKSQVRTKVLDALGQQLLTHRSQLCKSFKLICRIICQDFYNSWNCFAEKHLFHFQNHQVTLEQRDAGSAMTLH